MVRASVSSNSAPVVRVGQLLLGPVEHVGQRQRGPGGVRVGQLHLGPVSRVGQLQLGLVARSRVHAGLLEFPLTL